MLNPKHFRELIVRRTLERIGLWSQAAENIVFGTAVHESLLYHLKQQSGPALGFYQIEPATHRDIWDNYLRYHGNLALNISGLLGGGIGKGSDEDLIGNLYYATAICRVKYYRSSDPLPAADDIEGLAKYWKKIYNTRLGKGKVEDWIKHYMEIS